MGRRQTPRSRSATCFLALLAGVAVAGSARATTSLDVFRQLCLATRPDFEGLPARAATLGATAIPDDVHSPFGLLPSPQASSYWQIDTLDGTRAKLMVGTMAQTIAGTRVRSCFVAGIPETPLAVIRTAFPTAAIGERHEGQLYDWSRTVVVPDGPDAPLFMLAQGAHWMHGPPGRPNQDTETQVLALSMLSVPLDALPAVARELSVIPPAPTGTKP